MKDMKKSLGVILLALIIGLVVGIYLPNKKDKLSIDKTKVEDIINENLVRSKDRATVVGISSIGGVSKVDLNFNGKEDSLFVTNDGNLYLQKIMDLSEVKKAEDEAKSENIVKNKSDKPKVELFVMSYCPYGTQMEKGYLPVIKALGDKIDSKIKFVNYVMHGEKEAKENVLQYCIQKDEPEVFSSYLKCFLGKGEGSTDSCLSENGLSMNKLNSCINDTMKDFNVEKDLSNKNDYLNGKYPRFGINNDENIKYGVKGSPTLVINGQEIKGAARNSSSILKTICSAFKVQPEECNTVLSSETQAPGFGYSDSKTNSADGGCDA